MKKSILLLLLTCLSLGANAQRGLFVPTDNGQTTAATQEKRIALVVGNKDYSGGGWQPLRNSVNDANLMTTTLQNVGFEVITLNNATREQLQTGISQLTAKVANSRQTVALVYYAGHGVEAEGKNWLVPVNDRSACRDDISANCLSLDYINSKLKNAGAAFTIIISDACRNNALPFTCATSGRDGGKAGFVEFKAKGSCVAFSTAPNAIASDGTGSNSPYTSALAKAMLKEGLTIEGVFKQVSRDLDHLGQEPWVHNAFSGEFYFKMPESTVVTPQPPTPVKTDPVAPPTPTPQYQPSSMTAQEAYEKAEKYYQSEDYTEAVKWYRKAAEQDYAVGQNDLGYMYQSGKGVLKDYEKAVKWYRKAAEQGHAGGQRNLGNMYQYGMGVEEDFEEAVKWYRKAAEQGRANAQTNLGDMYKYGKGVQKDYEKAIKWYRKAAEQGDVNGQNNLGSMYEDGRGVQIDYEEAIKWYRKAAEQGNASGQMNLASMYYFGKGVTQSKETAIYWYAKAAAQGDEDAKTNLKNIRGY
jgi:TPR repeat protein